MIEPSTAISTILPESHSHILEHYVQNLYCTMLALECHNLLPLFLPMTRHTFSHDIIYRSLENDSHRHETSYGSLWRPNFAVEESHCHAGSRIHAHVSSDVTLRPNQY